MTTSNLASQFPKRQEPSAKGGDHRPAQGPMSQQDAADCHGRDMHPQKFVRLVGCHETNPAQAAHRLH